MDTGNDMTLALRHDGTLKDVTIGSATIPVSKLLSMSYGDDGMLMYYHDEYKS